MHFPITTKDPLAQQFFDQGVGQLHGFWYFEAERSFRQVSTLDPECAMAYWGLAMANINNEKRAKSFIEKAMAKEVRRHAPRNCLDRGPGGVVRGQGHHRATAQIHPRPGSARAERSKRRRGQGLSRLSDLEERQLDDREQEAIADLQPPGGRRPARSGLSSQPRCIRRITIAFTSGTKRKPARALVSASLCGQTSPLIAHMWHMPGHTYSKLHRYADAAWQQEASARVDHAHMMRDRVLPDQIHNYAHNNEWLIRDLAHVGRVHDAIDLAKNMIELPRHPKYNTAERSGTSSRLRTQAAGRRARCSTNAGRNRGLSQHAVFRPPATPDEKLKRARLLGLAWFGQGNVAEGQKQIAVVDELLKEKRCRPLQGGRRGRDQGPRRKEIGSGRRQGHGRRDGLARRGRSHVRTTHGGVARLRGAGRRQVRSARERIREAQGRRTPFARTIWPGVFAWRATTRRPKRLPRAAVEKGPGEVYPLAVLVEVLHRAGKKTEAQAEFAKLRPLAAFADLGCGRCSNGWRRSPPSSTCRPIGEARTIPRPTSGMRPDLASLGSVSLAADAGDQLGVGRRRR